MWTPGTFHVVAPTLIEAPFACPVGKCHISTDTQCYLSHQDHDLGWTTTRPVSITQPALCGFGTTLVHENRRDHLYEPVIASSRRSQRKMATGPRAPCRTE